MSTKQKKTTKTRSKKSSKNSQQSSGSADRVSFISDESELKYDQLIKLILIGDSGVGKTAIMQRFSTQDFDEARHLVSTIGVDFRARLLRATGRVYKVQLWDTAGQERYRSITTAYYGSAAAILIVYDCSSTSSQQQQQQVRGWIHEASRHNARAQLIVVANKTDLLPEPDVSLPLEAQTDYTHVRMSALSGQGFDVLLQRTMTVVLQQQQPPVADRQQQQQQPRPAKPRSGSPSSSGCLCLPRRRRMFEHNEETATVRLHGQTARLSVDNLVDLDIGYTKTQQPGSSDRSKRRRRRRRSCPSQIPLAHPAIAPQTTRTTTEKHKAKPCCIL